MKIAKYNLLDKKKIKILQWILIQMEIITLSH